MQNAATSAKQEPGLGLDIQIFMDVISGGGAEQRISLARQIAAFLCDAENPLSEREQVLPVAMRLVADESAEVRKVLSEGLSKQADLHADLLFAIVSLEDELALPFLSQTPALTRWHMLAVLRAGDEARQAIVALRSDITAEAVDFITTTLSLPVNALLLENTDAVIRPANYDKLYLRFCDEKVMLDILLARPDLPPVIRINQARKSAGNLHALVASRGWLPAFETVELVTDAEEVAIIQVLAAAKPEDLPKAITYLMDSELLTPSLIVRAACLGAMTVVAQCFAILADAPLWRVREQMNGKGSFRSLHAKCGLPQTCYWTLRAACDVARDEGDAGVRLSPDDFGRKLIETLLTRYESMPVLEQPRNLDFVSRFAADTARHLAKRLKADIQRAA
ncbi:DUF2336 domain-containing protein [Aestuariivirga sp.]|uniref:DUF2336 domain-containing protein n=1 Tax=Aestuariivirga sp. TaxID=2650926 RepID=UPI003BA8CDF4